MSEAPIRSMMPADPDFVADVYEGLTKRPKSIPPRWLYDERGSALFERITELPEYYLTRTERAIFARASDAIAAACSLPLEVIELGAGSAAKTKEVLRAVIARQGPTVYCPVDISDAALQVATRSLQDTFPELTIRPVVGRYAQALPKMAVENGHARLIMFIGSSIGNFTTEGQVAFLAKMSASMREQDRFLLGTDMVKDVERLEAAYDDSEGVTAAFTTNLLARINRELGGNFDVSKFRHVAQYDADQMAMVMHLESLVEQRVRIDALDLDVPFARGERLHTEDSHKYTEAKVDDIVSRSNFVRESTWYDEQRWFGVHLLRPI